MFLCWVMLGYVGFVAALLNPTYINYINYINYQVISHS